MHTAGPPLRVEPPDVPLEKRRLWENGRRALAAVPVYFQTSINIQGINAGDLFNLNGYLQKVVE
jgi:hypothetical protein